MRKNNLSWNFMPLSLHLFMNNCQFFLYQVWSIKIGITYGSLDFCRKHLIFFSPKPRGWEPIYLLLWIGSLQWALERWHSGRNLRRPRCNLLNIVLYFTNLSSEKLAGQELSYSIVSGKNFPPVVILTPRSKVAHTVISFIKTYIEKKTYNLQNDFE